MKKYFVHIQHRCLVVLGLVLFSFTAHAAQIMPDWSMHILGITMDPSIAYLLLLLGIYGILFESLNPGFILPGVMGAVAMCVALYVLHSLPINYAGLALIFCGIIFMIAESFTPTLGALGLVGAVVFVWGSIVLVGPEHERHQISWALIFAMTVFNIMVFVVGLNLALRSRRRPVQNGANLLMGASGKTLGPVERRGQAMIHGEIWSVYSKHPIRENCLIKVIEVKGICLEVEEQSEDLEQLDKGE